MQSSCSQAGLSFGQLGSEGFFSFLLKEKLNRIYFFFFFHALILKLLVHVLNLERTSPFVGVSGTECAWG